MELRKRGLNLTELVCGAMGVYLAYLGHATIEHAPIVWVAIWQCIAGIGTPEFAAFAARGGRGRRGRTPQWDRLGRIAGYCLLGGNVLAAVIGSAMDGPAGAFVLPLVLSYAIFMSVTLVFGFGRIGQALQALGQAGGSRSKPST